MLYRAKWVVPIAGDPIEDGGVLVRDDRIAAIGKAAALEGSLSLFEVRELGEVALLPGLVNTHSHLELTLMRGLLEELDFREWIGRLTDIKLNRMTGNDLIDSARLGALEAVRSGVTCCGDTCDSGLALDALLESGIRGIVYQEVFGPDPAQSAASLARLAEKVAQLVDRAGDTGRVRVGVSPHAPFTVSADLFRGVAAFARERGLPVAIHTAESVAEERFVRRGTGPFADRLAERNIPWTPPGTSTIAYLRDLGVLACKPLLVHAVHATDADAEAIAETGSAVAHCPKSNAKFGHGVAPLAKLLSHGVTVGLGTDSVASNNVVDMLDEARVAVLMARASGRDAAALSARRALELATIGGASALGLAGEIGSLEDGKRADLCAIALDGLHAAPVYDVETALVFSASARDVVLTVCGGRVVYDASRLTPTLLDEPRLRARMREIRTRIAAA
jgi:cytosine/adenosine deaminase-related metal-dependent hydrolase